MTREQYEAAVKAVIAATSELLKTAKNTTEQLNIVSGQAFQLEVLAKAYMENNK